MYTTAQPELKERIAMATKGITKVNANKVIAISLEMYRKQREASDLTLALILTALMAKYQCGFTFQVKPLGLHERMRIGTREAEGFRGRGGGAMHVPILSPDGITIVICNPFADDNQHREAIKTIWRGIAANEKEMNALITIRDERKNK